MSQRLGPEVYQLIPKGYTLDKSDPDVLVLRRDDKKKELEELRGLVHTGVSSPWAGMKMASLKRKYPRHYLKFEDEKKEAIWEGEPTEREPRSRNTPGEGSSEP